MCGISGYISKTNLINDNGIDRTLEIMKRRGPDSKNFFKKSYNSKQLALLHSRLNIIDLNVRANQPYYDENYIIVFNGEIYNYKKLIDQYDLDKRITSDCHVILEIYKKYDINEVLKAINGEFAFVLMDKTKGLIYMSRDIFGIRPLFSNIDFLLQISPNLPKSVHWLR